MSSPDTTVRIQPMTAPHVEGFHAAFDAVARERRFLTFLEAPSLEDTRAFALASMGRGNPHLVAMGMGGKVVGWCDIQRHGFPAHAHRGSLGMGLLDAFRGMGLGRRLLEAALAQAWEIGLTRVELSVHADNRNAIGLYRKVGFVEEGRMRDAFRADAAYRDALMMAIVRRPPEPAPPAP